jgi:hypothetical protein
MVRIVVLDIRDVALLVTIVIKGHDQQRVEQTVGIYNRCSRQWSLLDLAQVADLTRHSPDVNLSIFDQLTAAVDRSIMSYWK